MGKRKTDGGELAEVGHAVMGAVRASGMGKLVGQVEYRDPATVQPNKWNSNEMTPDEQRALEYGLRHDGWLVSQALLVWGSDEKGTPQNTIIDGEHRWVAATAIGFAEAPMVLLHGMTAAQAKKLSIALNTKRGHQNVDKLTALVRELDKELAGLSDNLADDLGLSDEQLAKMLADAPEEIDGGIAPPATSTPPPAAAGDTPGAVVPMGDMPSGRMAQVKMVQLFFDNEQHEEFSAKIKALGAHYGLPTVTDVVLRMVRDAHTRDVPAAGGGA